MRPMKAQTTGVAQTTRPVVHSMSALSGVCAGRALSYSERERALRTLVPDQEPAPAALSGSATRWSLCDGDREFG